MNKDILFAAPVSKACFSSHQETLWDATRASGAGEERQSSDANKGEVTFQWLVEQVW